MAQIICQNLSIGYGAKSILHNLNFSVNAGDYLCILGENGSGKSTLMKTILLTRTISDFFEFRVLRWSDEAVFNHMAGCYDNR
jgi:ABC-type multidrug transport system ATPase subunit